MSSTDGFALTWAFMAAARPCTDARYRTVGEALAHPLNPIMSLLDRNHQIGRNRNEWRNCRTSGNDMEEVPH